MSNSSASKVVFGLLMGGMWVGMLCFVCGHSVGTSAGLLIGESRTNAARDKAHYETCNLVRTFTPKNSPAVECYACPASTEETCLVPSWKGEVPK